MMTAMHTANELLLQDPHSFEVSYLSPSRSRSPLFLPRELYVTINKCVFSSLGASRKSYAYVESDTQRWVMMEGAQVCRFGQSVRTWNNMVGVKGPQGFSG